MPYSKGLLRYYYKSLINYFGILPSHFTNTIYPTMEMATNKIMIFYKTIIFQQQIEDKNATWAAGEDDPI